LDLLSTEEELVLEKNLVWVFADRRSGTTWLKELLSYNTKIMDEPLIGLHLGRTCFTPEHTVKRMIDKECNRTDYFFSKPYKEVWNYFLRKLILNRIHNQFNNLTDKIIIKEPSGSISSDIIAQCLPNSRIIILLRDPRDIVDSKVDEVSAGGWELKKGVKPPLEEKMRLEFIIKNASLWVGIAEILLDTYEKHSKDLRYILHYEDLLANTVKELQKLYQFLGIGVDENNLNSIVEKYSFKNVPLEEKGRGEFRRFASPGKWKENFNDEEKKILNDIIKNMLPKVGYQV